MSNKSMEKNKYKKLTYKNINKIEKNAFAKKIKLNFIVKYFNKL